MLKGRRNGVNQAQVNQACHHTGQHKKSRMHTLYLQKIHISQTDNQGLNHRQEDKDQLPAKICLVQSELLHLLILVHLLLQQRNQNHAAYPQRQIRIEGRHAGAVILHLIEGGRGQLDG